jgi:hypothetical protein
MDVRPRSTMMQIAATSTRTTSNANKKTVKPKIAITAIISAVSTIGSVKRPPSNDGKKLRNCAPTSQLVEKI